MRDAGAVVVAIATALAYATAFPGTFHYDDWNVVVNNPDVHGIGAWLASMPGIRPLTKATYALNWALDPERPAGFVAFDVACHLASAVVVLLLARRWLLFLAPARAGGMAALIAALTFALHPAQTEAVTYVAARSTALAGLLYFAALYAWERSRDEEALRWRALSLVLFLAALAARETAWTLPFAIVLVEAARGRRWRDALGVARAHFVVLAVALVAIAASPTYRRLLGTSLALRGPLDNLAAQVDGIAYLVTHPLLTLRLNLDPDLAPMALSAWTAIRAAGLIALVTLGIAQVRSRPWLGFPIAWFFLHLAPTNGAIARLDLANDRQLYLALFGPALAAGMLLARLRTPFVAIAASALAIGLGVATLVRNTDYASETALWEATARRSPGKARVFNNLGVAYAQSGEREKARVAFNHALALDPAHYKTQQNLQDLLVR